MKKLIFYSLIIVSLFFTGCKNLGDRNSLKKGTIIPPPGEKCYNLYGFKSEVSENCFWCGRHIDLNTSSVVILYNKNKKTEFIPDNFSIVMGKDTSKIGIWKYFLTEILCSQKCYKELKDTYFKDLKDTHIVCRRGNGKWDYYYYLIKD